MLVPFSYLQFFRIFSLSLKFSRRQTIVLGWLGWFFLLSFFFFFALWALSMIILSSVSNFSLKRFSTSASQSSQLSPTLSLIQSILRLFLLEWSSKSTDFLWIYSASSCHSYISWIRLSRCKGVQLSPGTFELFLRAVAAIKYLERGQGLKKCWPPWLANKENFRIWMV